MTDARPDPAKTQAEHMAFGGYVRAGSDHEVVAVRDHMGAWRLIDEADETATVIESFFCDEESDAVLAVATLYLAEMRSRAPTDAAA